MAKVGTWDGCVLPRGGKLWFPQRQLVGRTGWLYLLSHHITLLCSSLPSSFPHFIGYRYFKIFIYLMCIGGLLE